MAGEGPSQITYSQTIAPATRRPVSSISATGIAKACARSRAARASSRLAARRQRASIVPVDSATPYSSRIRGTVSIPLILVAVAQTASVPTMVFTTPTKEDPRRGLQSQPLPTPNANVRCPRIRVPASG